MFEGYTSNSPGVSQTHSTLLSPNWIPLHYGCLARLSAASSSEAKPDEKREQRENERDLRQRRKREKSERARGRWRGAGITMADHRVHSPTWEIWRRSWSASFGNGIFSHWVYIIIFFPNSLVRWHNLVVWSSTRVCFYIFLWELSNLCFYFSMSVYTNFSQLYHIKIVICEGILLFEYFLFSVAWQRLSLYSTKRAKKEHKIDSIWN